MSFTTRENARKLAYLLMRRLTIYPGNLNRLTDDKTNQPDQAILDDLSTFITSFDPENHPAPNCKWRFNVRETWSTEYFIEAPTEEEARKKFQECRPAMSEAGYVELDKDEILEITDAQED